MVETATVGGAGIHLRVVALVVVASGEFAIAHHSSVAFHQVFNPWLSIFAAGFPALVNANHIALLVHSHISLHLASGGDASIIFSEGLTVGIFHNLLDNETHRLVHAPTATFGELQVIVVGIVGALVVVVNPVAFKFAVASEIFIPQAEFARQVALVHLVDREHFVAEAAAVDGSHPTATTENQVLIVVDSRNASA